MLLQYKFTVGVCSRQSNLQDLLAEPSRTMYAAAVVYYPTCLQLLVGRTHTSMSIHIIEPATTCRRHDAVHIDVLSMLDLKMPEFEVRGAVKLCNVDECYVVQPAQRHLAPRGWVIGISFKAVINYPPNHH